MNIDLVQKLKLINIFNIFKHFKHKTQNCKVINVNITIRYERFKVHLSNLYI